MAFVEFGNLFTLPIYFLFVLLRCIRILECKNNANPDPLVGTKHNRSQQKFSVKKKPMMGCDKDRDLK